MNAVILEPLGSESIAEHREAAFGRLTSGFVFDYIPVFHQEPILHSNDVRHNPVRSQAETRVSPVHDNKVTFGYGRT